MALPPSGTVTFLFTDIEGSTKLAQQYPEDMPRLMRRHNEILTQSIQAHEGYVYEVAGDSFCAAFSSSLDAVHAALDAQGHLHREVWSPVPVKVRMGIHTGTVKLTVDNTYTGYATIALAQRVMSAGHGGQVLLSGATRELVRDCLPENSELVDLGERRLKDLLRPERLYQLNTLGLPSKFPPLNTLDVFPNNLPMQLTTFIGREKEMVEIKQELAEYRLVTLVGSGGTGKTRLSLQVAVDLLEQFPHGIWFIELAPLTDPDLIPQTILAAMDVNEQPGRSHIELLKEYLQGKKILIILDNCEHLIEASASVTDMLLNAAPDLKILASSREALRLRGELAYPVPSLSLPDIKHLPVEIEQLSQYEAVRLFIDRASLVSPGFVVDTANAPFIAQICHRLDGIPLAIELAAARVKVLAVDQISKRLDDRFRLLTGGSRTALPRQQTLRALIDWSYDLLTENERRLLCRLSIFANSWTLEAAEAICVGGDIQSYDVLDLLSQLVNKSLVLVIEKPQFSEKSLSTQAPLRYRMLETIRQYGREKLLEAGEGNTIRDKHFDYYLQAAKQILREYFGPKELIWLNWLDEEWDNLRAAVEWSIDARPDAGLDLVNCLGFLFLSNQNNLMEMQNWLMQLISHPENSGRTARRARGLLHWAWYANGNYQSSARIQRIEEAVSIYEELGKQNGLAHGYLAAALAADSLEAGSAHFEKALSLLHETNDKAGTAFALLHFGWLIETQNYARKLVALEKSLSIYRELGFISGTIEALKQLGALALRVGNFELAHLRLDEALSILQEHASVLGNTITMSYDLGDLVYYEGKYELARTYYENCFAWASQKGLAFSEAWANARLGYLSTRLGEWENARKFYQEALIPYQKSKTRVGVLFTVEGLASLAVCEKQWEKAIKLLSWATKQREDSGELRPPVEQTAVERDLETIRHYLTEMEISQLTAEASTMTIEEAIALALDKPNE